MMSVHIEEASVWVCPIMDGGGTKLKILDALSMVKLSSRTRLHEGIDVREMKRFFLQKH